MGCATSDRDVVVGRNGWTVNLILPVGIGKLLHTTRIGVTQQSILGAVLAKGLADELLEARTVEHIDGLFLHRDRDITIV